MAKDRGWDYLNSSGEDFDYDKDNDGSWGYENEDGSGSFYGADGSWGYKNADGSASYYGADGSWGYKNADGSASYYGNDGSWGYKNEDGSGSYYDENGDAEYSSSDDESDYSSSSGDSGGSVLGTLVGMGIAAYGISKLAKTASRNTAYDEDDEDDEEDEDEDDDYSANDFRTYSQSTTSHHEPGSFLKAVKRFFITVGVIAVLALIAVVAYFIDAFVNGIEVGYDNSSVVLLNYEKEEAELKEKGFLFVSAESVADLDYENVDKKNTVSSIIVNGKDDYDAEDTFSRFSHIKIIYHTAKKVETPISAKAAKGENYVEIVERFKEAGFGNIETEADYDVILGWINSSGDIEKITIDGYDNFSEGGMYSVDAIIHIIYHEKSSLKPD